VRARLRACLHACLRRQARQTQVALLPRHNYQNFWVANLPLWSKEVHALMLLQMLPPPFCRYSEPNRFLHSFINALNSLNSFWRSEKSCLGAVSWLIWAKDFKALRAHYHLSKYKLLFLGHCSLWSIGSLGPPASGLQIFWWAQGLTQRAVPGYLADFQNIWCRQQRFQIPRHFFTSQVPVELETIHHQG